MEKEAFSIKRCELNQFRELSTYRLIQADICILTYLSLLLTAVTIDKASFLKTKLYLETKCIGNRYMYQPILCKSEKFVGAITIYKYIRTTYSTHDNASSGVCTM